ncbi:MAG: lipid II flippase MurJ [Candidatus Limnocylindrales bacterium]
MHRVEDSRRSRPPGRVGAAEAAFYGDPPEDRGGGRSSDGGGLGGDGGGMFERARELVRAGLPRGAVILGVLFAVNAGSGFLAKKVVGHVFGAGPESDAFWNAAALTSFPVDLLITGGIVGPFLPLFMGLKGEAEAAARDFARTILTAALIVMAAAIALVFAFAPQIASFSAPGFTGSQRDLYIGLVRVICLGQISITASMVLGEVLIAERRFLAYGLAEFAEYAGIAAGALLLGGVLGIYGAAVGFLFGALGHLGVRLVGIYRTSFRPRPSLSLRTKGVDEFALLMLPKMVSSGLVSLLLLYFNQIASTLAPGSTTAVSYAQDFRSTAESVVGLSFALAAFPALSAAAAAGEARAFRRLFRTNLLTIGFFSILAAAVLAMLAGFIAGLFRGGAFDDTDVSRMTLVLVVLAFSVPFESLVELFARAIYATHNTSEPMVAVAAGFIAGVATTVSLSPSVGLAALPIGYVAFRVVHLAVLGIFLRPRMARIGDTSKRSRVVVRNRWAGFKVADRRALPTGRSVVVAVLAAALIGGTVLAGAQVLSNVSIAGNPETTPWTRIAATRPPVVGIASSAPTAAPTAPPSPSAPSTAMPTASVPSTAMSTASVPSTSGAASPTIGPTTAPATPGVFAMDLYQAGDFVSEFKDTWCVPAAMQTSMNLMNAVPDTSRDTQARLFDLAVSIAGSPSGGADPIGWAKGLTSLGYGNYEVGSKLKMSDVMHIVAKQIRVTQRPAGLLVWYGWHSWVVSGFTATADPALTDSYTVLSLRIEDVWYPRISKIWGASRPPDSDVPVGQLPKDYKTWVQAKFIQGRDGYFVYVIPVA